MASELLYKDFLTKLDETESSFISSLTNSPYTTNRITRILLYKLLVSSPGSQEMGISGTLDYLSDLLIKKKKKKQLRSVSLKVRMCCEGCGHHVKNVLSRVKGAKSVETIWKQQKATVYGHVEPKKVLAAAKATRRKCELWPFVPANQMAHPYAPGVYDKKAPPNMVRKSYEPGVATLDPVEEKYALMFSDDNIHACTIM